LSERIFYIFNGLTERRYAFRSIVFHLVDSGKFRVTALFCVGPLKQSDGQLALLVV